MAAFEDTREYFSFLSEQNEALLKNANIDLDDRLYSPDKDENGSIAHKIQSFKGSSTPPFDPPKLFSCDSQVTWNKDHVPSDLEDFYSNKTQQMLSLRGQECEEQKEFKKFERDESENGEMKYFSSEPHPEIRLYHEDSSLSMKMDLEDSPQASSFTRNHEPRRKVSIIVGEHDHNVDPFGDDVQVFYGEWDDEGVFFYQAYNDEIADWALEHQKFGGPKFNSQRMTWIKPSFAWVLYRSGYGHKHNQNRVLKIKLSHDSLAVLLTQCQCKEGGGGSKGRVQWDPERDIMVADKKVPRQMLRRRAIQIGLSKDLSDYYVNNTISIQDVTGLSRKVCEAHRAKDPKAAIAHLLPQLPVERPYLPRCLDSVLMGLKMRPPQFPSVSKQSKLGKKHGKKH